MLKLDESNRLKKLETDPKILQAKAQQVQRFNKADSANDSDDDDCQVEDIGSDQRNEPTSSRVYNNDRKPSKLTAAFPALLSPGREN